MIWSKNHYYPLHWPHNPFTINFVNFVLIDVLNLVHCLIQGMDSLLLHLSISELSISTTGSTILQILLVIVLYILSIVFKILSLDMCIISLLFKNNHILQVLTDWLG